MKFHLNTSAGNVFTGYGDDYVRLGIVLYRENIVVTPERILTGWCPAGFDALTEARIGLDVMDTPAACRTFNILAAEERKVAVAILLDPQSPELKPPKPG